MLLSGTAICEAARVAAAAMATALVIGACGASHAHPAQAGIAPSILPAHIGQMVVQPQLPAGAVVELPARSWALSFDLRLPRGSRLAVERRGGALVTFSGRDRELMVAFAHGPTYALRRPRGWLGGGRWHLEATNTRLAVDGHALRPLPGSRAAEISFSTAAGHPVVGALIATPAANRGLMLLHRLAELHARVPPRQFPLGATTRDGIVYGTTYWTSGFWPGALWQAAMIAPQGGLFARWASAATIQHFGQEHADTHDVGFMYDESSLAAWRALCRTGSGPLCPRFERSALSAAAQLVALAKSNPGAGTIPTNADGTRSDTIIDSMMNVAILPWASRVSGNPMYARLARHHADVVSRLLVRPDGSTAQAVDFDRATGRVLSIGTHQGLSDSSTWSRGEGWALYGFAQAARDLRDRALLRVALRVAGYVSSHLPAGAIPRWDYDAPPGAPVDVSAGAITAAGFFHLVGACAALPGTCPADTGRWMALGRRMLTAAVAHASARPPLGLLDSQILNERGRGCWCDGGELIFGVTYGLEALRLAGAYAPIVSPQRR